MRSSTNSSAPSGSCAALAVLRPHSRLPQPRRRHPARRDRAHLPAVLREALPNATGHAHATAVQAAVRARHELLLEVSDNGRGIDPPVPHSSDLTNLRRRIEKLGGAFVLTGRSAVGTRLSCHIPLSHQARSHPLARA
ncbi:ATP-binding protein [Streptomyces sp. NPDC087859]|uniref:ATP-binding protein n=1 Tax=Streptomyces sp. NPDC087859 TaxID=3365812 RepID=UPI00380C1FA1